MSQGLNQTKENEDSWDIWHKMHDTRCRMHVNTSWILNHASWIMHRFIRASSCSLVA